ncbi:MAG: hypothetical protein ACYTGP_05485 [Planctomycetota bacterium]|jgi:hypothetical protein
MHPTTLVRSALLASVLGTTGGIATADVTLYTSSSDLNTAATGGGMSELYTENYESSAIGGAYAMLTPPLSSGVPNSGFPTGLDSPDLSIDVVNGGNFMALAPSAYWPDITSVVVGASSGGFDSRTLVEFGGDGVAAVGLNVWGVQSFSDNAPAEVEYTIYDTTGGVLSTGLWPTPTSTTGAFFGVMSTDAIGGVELRGLKFGLDTAEYVNAIQAFGGSAAVPGDANGDGLVNFADILSVIGAWGACTGCPEDLNGSGDVGFDDILVVIANWS